jgi:hypothetical protein
MRNVISLAVPSLQNVRANLSTIFDESWPEEFDLWLYLLWKNKSIV